MPIKYSLCNHPLGGELLDIAVIFTVHAFLFAITSGTTGVSR
jgi:hypothetical protein